MEKFTIRKVKIEISQEGLGTLRFRSDVPNLKDVAIGRKFALLESSRDAVFTLKQSEEVRFAMWRGHAVIQLLDPPAEREIVLLDATVQAKGQQLKYAFCCYPEECATACTVAEKSRKVSAHDLLPAALAHPEEWQKLVGARYIGGFAAMLSLHAEMNAGPEHALMVWAHCPQAHHGIAIQIIQEYPELNPTQLVECAKPLPKGIVPENIAKLYMDKKEMVTSAA